jgi:DNA invertase Pin-like site-specific DNA recombinase
MGIEAAKARGVAWGRSATITPEKEKVIAEMRSRQRPAKEIIEAIGVSRTTYFNYLKEHGLSKNTS